MAILFKGYHPIGSAITFILQKGKEFQGSGSFCDGWICSTPQENGLKPTQDQ